jgi:hypothetical protein
MPRKTMAVALIAAALGSGVAASDATTAAPLMSPKGPVLGSMSPGGPMGLMRGQPAVYSLQVTGRQVKTLQATLRLPAQVQIVKEHSTHYVLVGGHPRFVMHDINNLFSLDPNKVRTIRFALMAKSGVHVGTTLVIRLDVVATSGAWKKTGTNVLKLRVRG